MNTDDFATAALEEADARAYGNRAGVFCNAFVSGAVWARAHLAAQEPTDAEHRIARLEAQTDIRGRAVAIYQQRAREAKERIQAVEDALDGYTKFIHVEHIRAALEQRKA